MDDPFDVRSLRFRLARLEAHHQVVTEGIEAGELNREAFASADVRATKLTDDKKEFTGLWRWAEEWCRAKGLSQDSVPDKVTEETEDQHSSRPRLAASRIFWLSAYSGLIVAFLEA